MNKEKDNYSFLNYILIFFSFALVGWLYEVILHIIRYGEFVNKGALFGPWLPIYGYGSVIIILLLKRFKSKPWLVFILSMLIAGVIEYITAWYLETFLHMKWWDYTGFFLNIQGRVCLMSLAIFAVAGLLGVYLIGPLLNKLFNKINPNVKKIICIILVLLFAIDKIHSFIKPNTGEGITQNIELAK